MKKRLLLSVMVCSLLMFGCNMKDAPVESSSSDPVVASESDSNADVVESTAEMVEEKIISLDAQQVLEQIKALGVGTVGTIVVYDEVTDTNNLLGRPNQYTSKVNFEDTRVEQHILLDKHGNPDPVGGTIEVFNNEEDTTSRRNHIERIEKSLPTMVQYLYQRNNILLRIDKELTPTQASEYEKALSLLDPDLMLEIENPASNSKSKATDLFENVYAKYANREMPFAYTAVKEFAQSSKYKAEIVEPSSDTLGTIKLYDSNGDYVYFGFNASNGVQTVMTVSFYKASSKTEVSMSNYSSDGNKQYDKFKSHVIGKGAIDVSGVDEQRTILFF